MSKKFYYMNGEEVCGPYEATTILGKLRKGDIAPDTVACAEGSEDWKPIYRIKDLSPDAVTPPAARQQQPGIAAAVQIIGGVVLSASLLAAVIIIATGPKGGALGLGLAVAIGGIVTSVFQFALASMLTWVYNIMLNTEKMAKQGS